MKTIVEKLKITDTTDGKYIGHEFTLSGKSIVLTDGIEIFFDRIIPLPNGSRFASSSYIIDTVKVK